jgi:hypothetical protein
VTDELRRPRSTPSQLALAAQLASTAEKRLAGKKLPESQRLETAAGAHADAYCMLFAFSFVRKRTTAP